MKRSHLIQTAPAWVIGAIVFGYVGWLTSCSDSNQQIRHAADPDAFKILRQEMVRRQLRERDIRDPRVLNAMANVPRHEFVPQSLHSHAYEDHPLSIAYDQTISQPYIVAFMTEKLALKSTDRVLEIGTGSGYQAAILAELAQDVFSIEIIEELAAQAEKTLTRLGYGNIKVRYGDGYLGWPEHAPFDSIIVTCAPNHVPQPLVDQLKEGGA